MIQPKKVIFEDMTVHFRWVLPIMLAGYMYAYHRDVQWQKDNFNELKETQADIKRALSKAEIRSDDRFAYVYQQCCSEARTSPRQTVEN